METIWKTIKNYENHYEVSNKGQVRSKDRIVSFGRGTRTITSKILKPVNNQKDYFTVVLSKNSKVKREYIHRLVAFAFLENQNNYKEINHIDGDKSNNNLYNLEWCTSLENKLHAYEMGLAIIGTDSNLSKYSKEFIENIQKELLAGRSQASISRQYSISKAHVCRIKNNKTRRYLNMEKKDASNP